MIRDTLQQFADGWDKLGVNRVTFEQFVLEHGKTYYNVGHGETGEMKGCFRNAGRLVIDSPTAVYVEGYASSDRLPIPILHAWIERRDDGAAFEVTWDDPEDHEYFGIRYQTEFLRKQILRHGCWGILGGDPETAHGLLTGRTPIEEWKL